MTRDRPTRPRTRSEIPRILVVCGGVRTEIDYLDALHLTDVGRSFADARDVARELRRAIPGYDKTRLVFDDFVGGIAKAVERARRLEKDDADGTPNPSSGMWRLVARIVGDETRVAR